MDLLGFFLLALKLLLLPACLKGAFQYLWRLLRLECCGSIRATQADTHLGNLGDRILKQDIFALLKICTCLALQAQMRR
jgi:hypothetical protein